MHTDTHPINVISVPSGHRTLNEEGVMWLMNSIKFIGLQTPPTVRIQDGDPPILVSGRHRLEACKRLGWQEIPVIVMDGDAVKARLWEISENLHRAELTPVERAEQIDEWRRLTAEQVLKSATPSGGRQPREAGVRKAAEQLGVNPSEVSRAAKIAALPQDTRDKAREEGWTASRLLEQARPPRAPVMAAEPRNDLEAIEAQVSRLMAAWNAAGPEAREEFWRRVDVPVFDRTRASD